MILRKAPGKIKYLQFISSEWRVRNSIGQKEDAQADSISGKTKASVKLSIQLRVKL
jgi:hypothetical protein